MSRCSRSRQPPPFAPAWRDACLRRVAGGESHRAAELRDALNGITVVGSIVGTRFDLREVFELHAAGMTHVVFEERPLEQVNEEIAEVERGDVKARVVLRP